MSNVIKFTSSMTNSKIGSKVIKPDSNGYYELVLGALNIENSAGAIYDLEAGKKLFEDSGILMRRVNNGQLRGELGHTKRLVGMSNREYMAKVVSVNETNVSHHIKELKLDYDYSKTVSGLPDNCVVIIGLVKPSGPHGEILKEALDNPDENVAFSIRSITSDRIERGILIKYLKYIVTFDWVNEPGIATATKWKKLGIECLYEEIIDVVALEDIVHSDMCVGMEESVTIAKDIIDISQADIQKEKRQYTKW